MQRLKRIFHSHPDSEIFSVGESGHHYLKNVLRMSPGDDIEILTPKALLTAKITEQKKRETVVTVLTSRDLERPRYSLAVFQCILKREYMDTAVEKYAELGVTTLIPVVSSRSIHELKPNTLMRYREIAKNAALQSEQEFVMEIAPAMKLSNIRAAAGGDNLLFYERAEVNTLPAIKSRNVQMIIGPEGGFTDSEADALQEAGFTPVSPIKSILKAETAAIAFTGWVRIQLEWNR